MHSTASSAQPNRNQSMNTLSQLDTETTNSRKARMVINGNRQRLSCRDTDSETEMSGCRRRDLRWEWDSFGRELFVHGNVVRDGDVDSS